jgi:hypothetical protein
MNLAMAVEYGTNESLFLTNLCFWIEKNKANKAHFHQGRYWVYNTMEAWAELFPYFSKEQIRHLIAKLKQQGALFIGTFNKVRYDRTLWYSVSDDVLRLYNSGFNPLPKQAFSSEKTPESKCPKGRMDVGDSPDATALEGASICENSQIEVGNFPNRSGEIPTPIPYIKPIHKPDAACEKNPATKQKSEAAADFSKNAKINEIKASLHEVNPQLLFDNKFYPRAIKFMSEQGLNLLYFNWLLKECEGRKPENLRGLFYSLFFQPDLAALFKEYQKAHKPPKPIIKPCPSCCLAHDVSLDACPACGLRKEDTQDPKKINFHKKFFALPQAEREAYEKDRDEVFSLHGGRFSNYPVIKSKWEEINRKYHLLD